MPSKAHALKATGAAKMLGRTFGMAGAVFTAYEGATDGNGFTLGDGVKVGIGILTTFTQAENRKHFLVSGIEAKYKFKWANVKGQCSVMFVFGGYSKNEKVNSELEIMVNSFSFDKGCKANSRNTFQSKIIEVFEKNKFIIYEKYRQSVI